MLHTLRWHNWHTYQAQFFTLGWHIYVIFLFFLPKIPCLHRQTASLFIFLQMKNAVARSGWKPSTVLEASGSGNRPLPPCSWGRGWCTFCKVLYCILSCLVYFELIKIQFQEFMLWLIVQTFTFGFGYSQLSKSWFDINYAKNIVKSFSVQWLLTQLRHLMQAI